MPITSPRVQALLSALCVFPLLPHGFTNRDLRNCLAPLLGLDPEAMTSGQITYDLRQLRIHGLIQRIPHTFRYQVTPAGIRQARFLTRLTQRLLIPAWPSSPTPAHQSPPGCGPPTVPTTPPSTTSPATPGSPPDHVPATSGNDSPPPDLTIKNKITKSSLLARHPGYRGRR
jgi:hypothetical protein